MRFAKASVASVTAPDHKVCNPMTVAAFSVAAMTIAASDAVLAIRIAALVTAPPIVCHIVVRHIVGGHRWRGCSTFLGLEQSLCQHPRACLRPGDSLCYLMLPIRGTFLDWLVKSLRYRSFFDGLIGAIGTWCVCA